MRIAKVIGKVTLNRSHPSYERGTFKLAVPQSLANLRGESEAEGDSLVVWDDLGAGVGSLIALSESGEATQPFRPDLKPVDAYNAAILDSVNVHRSSTRMPEA